MHREVVLQGKILADLRSRGKDVVAFKIEDTSDDGVPDIYFTSKATGGVFIECKMEGKKPRKLQRFQINKINNCGGVAYACDTWESWVSIKAIIGMPARA